jgi:hypothetical protein
MGSWPQNTSQTSTSFGVNKTPPPRITIGTTGLLINDTLVEIDDRCVAGFPTGLPRAMEI